MACVHLNERSLTLLIDERDDRRPNRRGKTAAHLPAQSLIDVRQHERSIGRNIRDPTTRTVIPPAVDADVAGVGVGHVRRVSRVVLVEVCGEGAALVCGCWEVVAETATAGEVMVRFAPAWLPQVDGHCAFGVEDGLVGVESRGAYGRDPWAVAWVVFDGFISLLILHISYISAFAMLTRVEDCLVLAEAGEAAIVRVACLRVSVDLSIRLYEEGVVWVKLKAADCRPESSTLDNGEVLPSELPTP